MKNWSRSNNSVSCHFYAANNICCSLWVSFFLSLDRGDFVVFLLLITAKLLISPNAQSAIECIICSLRMCGARNKGTFVKEWEQLKPQTKLIFLDDIVRRSSFGIFKLMTLMLNILNIITIHILNIKQPNNWIWSFHIIVLHLCMRKRLTKTDFVLNFSENVVN